MAILPAAALALALTGAASATDPGEPVSGDGIVPIEVAGNPSCQDLGYGYGFKIENNYNRTVTLTAANGSLTGGAPSDPYNTITVSSADNVFFNWLSTLSMDAVIVKGGDAANAYVYIPEDNGDTGLASPENASGGPAGISHIEFCYDYELTASKTANATYTRTYTWTLDKRVNDEPDDAAEYSGFPGDTFAPDYDIEVDQTVTDSNFAVSGSITVNNPTPFTVSFTVSDSVGGSAAAVSCPTTTLLPGASTTCTYSASLGAKTNGTNTATITSTTVGIGGATASATYTFGDPTSTVGYPTVNVTDTFPYPGGTPEALGSASGDFEFDNDQALACSTNPADYTNGTYSYTKVNRAEITETGAYDDAQVTVTCYAPVVTKDVQTSTYDESSSWKITKSVNPTSQSGYPGDKLGWTWTVSVEKTTTASDFLVGGNIYVQNPAATAMTVSVADVLNDGTNATVDCSADPGNQSSLTVPAGQSRTCTYTATPTGKTATLNTATATIGGASFQGTAPVVFTPADVTGATARVTDPIIGLDETTAKDATFTVKDSHTCSASWAAYGADGTYSDKIDNTATVTWDTDKTATANATTAWTCNAVTVDLLKLTNGVRDPEMVWTFKLYKGPDGFGSAALATDTTPPALMDFGNPALRPDTKYTVCELNVMAGWSSTWKLNGGAVLPYNPDADLSPPEDNGNRCFDFGGTVANPATTGTTFSFEVDNRAPGGDPRTPGYWKNWSSCTGGGQYAKTLPGVDPDNDYISLDEVLTSPGITWDDILSDSTLFEIKTCAVAVDILDKRIVADPTVVGDGKKAASNSLTNLATHLLAAQLNFGAGACTTGTVNAKALAAETLLDKYNFQGQLVSGISKADVTAANTLAKYLDEYNNGKYCGSLKP